jgi:hypothetical protein
MNPDTYCPIWFENGRQRNVHPVTGATIDPDSPDWNYIEETCSDFMYGVPIGDMKHPGNSVRIPKRRALAEHIRSFVGTVWTNPLVKRATYMSSDGASDLFSGDHWDENATPQIVCPSKAPDGWKDFKTLDDRKSIMSHCTTFVTTHMLGNITTRLRFLKLVSYAFQVLFETLKIEYDDERFASIVLVLKGGMALRMNVLELIRAFSSEMEGFMVDLLHAELKLSDFDFEVVSSGLSIEEVSRLNVLTFMVTMAIRNHIDDHKEYFLDFFQYSVAYRRKLMSDLHSDVEDACKQLSMSNFFHGIHIDYIAFGQETLVDTQLYSDRNTSSMRTNRSDFALVIDGRMDGDHSDVCFMSARNLLYRYNIPRPVVDRLCRQSLLFTSHNPLITFTEGDVRSSFQLNRIKYGFKVYFRKVLPDGETVLLTDYFPGELLDVSHQLHNDTRQTWNRQESRFPRYHASSIRHMRDLHFHSLTPYGQIQEHRFMLFKAVKFPWEVDKYEKRMVRLLCIFFLFVFSVDGPRYSFSRKLAFMDSLKTDIQNQMMTESIPAFIIRQIRTDIVNVINRGMKDESRKFRDVVVNMLSTLIRVFEHEYRRSRNPKLTVTEYDPLVFTQLFND